MKNIRSLPNRFFEYADRLSTARAVLLLICLSLLIKLAYIQFAAGGLGSFPAEGTDGRVFDQAARVLLADRAYGADPGQAMLQPPPGDAFLLAGLYAVSGQSIVVAKLAHVALLTF